MGMYALMHWIVILAVVGIPIAAIVLVIRQATNRRR
jgi:hypothetical protein